MKVKNLNIRSHKSKLYLPVDNIFGTTPEQTRQTGITNQRIFCSLKANTISQYPFDFVEGLFYYVRLRQERCPEIHPILLPPKT